MFPLIEKWKHNKKERNFEFTSPNGGGGGVLSNT